MNDLSICIYKKLIKLVPKLWLLKPGQAFKSNPITCAYMPLSLDILYKTEQRLIIALSHYYKDEISGDMIPDSNMEIRISTDGWAEALSYQDAFSYQRAYLNEQLINLETQKCLNNYLNTWLTNCIRQEHILKE